LMENVNAMKKAPWRLKSLSDGINNLKILKADRERTDRALRDSEIKYRRLFEAALDGILILDGDSGKITDVNPLLLQMLGYSRDELLGKNLWEIRAFTDIERSKEAFRELQQNTYIRYENLPLETKDGRPFAVEFISNVYLVDGKRVIQCNIRDITEREQLKQKLQEMATHDPLTGLPNRTLMHDRFEIAIASARRKNIKTVLMSLDLDHFKDVNDSFGHDVGDGLLRAAANRLTCILRKSDTVARIGGDEFVILLAEVDYKEDSAIVANKILSAFQRPFVVDSHDINSTVSIGIAAFPDDGGGIEILLKRSDQALYRAKENGRNNYQLTS
jgi:diguanylate cyclase (GGDEF)-like protein/PAS domain S-box-containing protein